MAKSTRYIAFDVETTGLSAENDRIVQFAAIDVTAVVKASENGTVNFRGEAEQFVSLVDPEKKIPSRASAIHGIDNRKVEGSPTFSDIAQELRDYIAKPGTVLIGHNLSFDMQFLNASLKRAGLKGIGNNVRRACTLKLAQLKLDGILPNYKLATVAGALGHDLTDAHDASADAIASAAIYASLTTAGDITVAPTPRTRTSGRRETVAAPTCRSRTSDRHSSVTTQRSSSTTGNKIGAGKIGAGVVLLAALVGILVVL
jgi:DNA polymerase III epsilon subunit family exonuclease